MKRRDALYRHVHDEEVFRGSRSQVGQIRSALDAAAAEINRRDLDYGIIHLFSESQNSNSVYGTLMGVAAAKARDIGANPVTIPGRLLDDQVVFDPRGRSSWAPGIHRDLLAPGQMTAPARRASRALREAGRLRPDGDARRFPD